MAFVFEDDKQAAAPVAGADGGRYVFEDAQPAKKELSFRQGSDPSLIDRVFDLFADPETERAKAVQALVDSEALGIRPSDAYRYRNAIDSGVKMNKNAIEASRRTNVMDRVKQSWDIGLKQNQLGLIGYDYITTGDPKHLESMGKVGMPTEDETFVSESGLEDAFRAAAKMTPMMLHIGKESLEKGLPVGMGAGLAAFILGQAGPQMALPEELLTVPLATAAGLKTGSTAAAFHEALKMESGLAVAEIMQFKDKEGNQIDPDIARASAFGVGVVNAAIEVSQIKLLLKTIPGMDKVLGRAVMETVTSKAVKDKLLAIAGSYAGTIAKETGQEVAQESTNIVFEELAKNLNNAAHGTDIDPAKLADVVDRLYATAKESAQAFAVMAAPGNVVKAGMAGKKENAKAVPNKNENKNVTTLSRPVTDGESVTSGKRSENPFIIGVNESPDGTVTSFTMADPLTGQTFEVPAQKSEDKERVSLTPDMAAVNSKVEELRAAQPDELDGQLDRIISGDEDMETAAGQFFGETEQVDDVDEMGFVGDTDIDIQIKRGREIINEMTIDHTDRPDAMRRDDVGSIEFPWGKEGNPKKEFKQGFGISHIIAKHGSDVVHKVVEVIGRGQIVRVYGPEDGKRVNIEYDGHTAVLSLRKKGKDDTWLLTGWQNKTSDELGEVNGPAEPTHDGPMRTRPNMVAEVDNSIDPKGGIVNKAKAINDSIGEKGYVDLAPIIDLGRMVWDEGHQTIETFKVRTKELLSSVWETVKEIVHQAWDKLKEERGSISKKKKYDVDEINELLDMAGRQDKAEGPLPEQPSYDQVRQKAAQMAFEKIQKKIDFKQRKDAAALKRQGKDDARQLPVFQAMEYIAGAGGLKSSSLLKDYDPESVRELAKRRIGLVKKDGAVQLDVVADQFGYEAADDLYNDMMDWQGLEEEGRKLADDFQYHYGDLITTAEMDNFNEELMQEEDKIMKSLTTENRPKPAKGLKSFIRQKTGQAKPTDKMVPEYTALTEMFKKEAATARQAFSEGKKEEVERSKEVMRWLVKRRQSMKNVRDYFNLTDAELMSVTNRRNPALMDDTEFKQFLKDIELKAVLLAENKQAKIELMLMIETKRLQKVDNYRQALELPTFDNMTTEQLRQFAQLIEPFQDDDVFLTQRELETVDRTDLKGIKTWREARERLAKEAGVDVEDLAKVHVSQLDSYRWDSSLRERDPFFDILVTRMTEAVLGAELRAHNVESQVYELAKKAEKSHERGLVDRMIPHDDLIMAFLESPPDRKAAIVEQMTPEQLDYAHFMQQYFADALNYLIATKSLERGRENYFVHVRRSFLEKMRDGSLKAIAGDVAHGRLKDAFDKLFENQIQDQLVFNILDDDTGNILPLEKFFQFSMQRTDVMDPTRNVTKAFLTYMRTFEKKKMFDAIIPKLDIYAQALTPTRYTPRGLEIDRSLKTFVNKWINNKKGRRISFDSTLRQGGPLDTGIRALRTFTTMLDLGLAPVAQLAAFAGEQVTNAAMLGPAGMATGTARMRTEKGKRILQKYEAFVGRSLWEEFSAPGKEVTERLSDMLFAGFHLSTVSANKQFLLASLTEQEWEAETISVERLAKMRLNMGRFRVVPGTGSLVGSTSAGDAVMQYKKWAVPLARTLLTDGETLVKNMKDGKPLDDRARTELIRFSYLTGSVFIVGAMAGADDKEDKSYIGKAKARMYREAMTLTQGMNPLLFIGVPRTWTWVIDTVKALKDLILLEEYKTKDGLKGTGELKRQFVPGVARQMVGNN